MTPQQIGTLLQQILETYNEIITNAKSIEEFDEQLTLLVDSYMLVSDAGVTKKMKLQQIISAISQTYIDRLIYVGEIDIVDNDVTVPEGAQALISNITYFTTIDYTFTVPFSDTGKTRTDIIIMNTSAVLTRISGVETVGIAVRPNIPPNTVLVTQINVTEDSLTAVPGLLFLGEFDSIEYLEATHPTALTGSYAIVTNLTDSAIYFYSEFNGWFGVGSTYNLQSVTDEGHETTNIMTFTFPSGNTIEIKDGSILLQGTNGEKSLISVEGLAQLEVYDNTTDNSINLTPNNGFRISTNGGNVSVIRNDNTSTEVQLFQLPDKTDGLPHSLATQDDIVDAVAQLIDGAPSDSNTLKELNDKIVAINAIIGGSTADGDSLVNTVAELLAVFSAYPEGTDIATVLAGKVNVSDIVNNLTQIVSGKVLDAAQGKVLKDLIDALTTTVGSNTTAIGTKISKHSGATYTTNAIQTLTQAEYDAIGTKDANTLYFII